MSAPQEAVSGIRTPPKTSSSAWIWTKRSLLFVPRWLFRTVMAPPRLGLWALDRYSLEDRYKRIFFNDEGSIGLYPFIDVASGFGASFGATFIDKDLFHRTLQVKVSARTGGRDRETYQLQAGNNRPIAGVVDVSFLARYAASTRGRFYGIGNEGGSEGTTAMPPTLALPDSSFRAEYRQRDTVLALETTLFPQSPLRLRTRLRTLQRTYDPNDENLGLGEPLESIYDTTQLVGYDLGLANVYGDLQAIADYRRRTTSYRNPPVHGSGWLASASVGTARGWGDDPSRYLRYSADVRRYIDLYLGDRVLILRGRVLAIAGKSRNIPFDALPFLGGRTFLRGYQSQRFREKVAVLSSAEYQYPIAHNIKGHVFGDLGRVYHHFDELGTSDLRFGFGGGLDFVTAGGTVARMALSSSIDGNFYFNLGFEEIPDVHTK